MHIAEGIMTGAPALAYTGVALGLMAAGVRRMRRFAVCHPRQKPLLGMAGAFIFFVSLIPIPAFTGTCTHPCGSPLAGILLGPWIGTALTGLSLLLQAAFFAHGGFSTWGANVITLGVGGAVCGWLVFRGARLAGLPMWLAGALGGLLGDLMTYAIAGCSLAFTLAHAPTPQYSFGGYLAAIYLAYLPTQLPIALGEMLVTGLTLHHLQQQRTDILDTLGVLPHRIPTLARALLIPMIGAGLWVTSAQYGKAVTDTEGPTERTATAVAVPSGAAYAAVERAPGTPSPAAPPSLEGMDEAVNMRLAESAGRPARTPYLDTESWGDLWNTLLLLAGGLCGFILGRYWHLLFGRSRQAARQDPVFKKRNMEAPAD